MENRGRGRGARGQGERGRGNGRGRGAGGGGQGGQGERLLLWIPGLKRLRLQTVERRFDAGVDDHQTYGTTTSADGSRLALNESGYNYLKLSYRRTPQPNYRTKAKIVARVSGLFYVGPIGDIQAGDRQHDTDANVADYWRQVARRQLGGHLYMTRWGRLYYLIVALVSPALVSADQLPTYGCNASTPMAVHQQFPNIRVEHITRDDGIRWEDVDNPEFGRPVESTAANPTNTVIWESTRQNGQVRRHLLTYRLTVGALYQEFANGRTNRPYAAGERYYFRESIYNFAREWGQVWELTDVQWRYRIEQMVAADPTCARFAIYVCAGAKLVVMDALNENTAGPPTSQTLYQMGGVVVGEGNLEVMGPVFAGTHGLRGYTVGEAIKARVLCAKTDAWTAELAKVNNPVLFLAPHESQYGSSTWQLMVISVADPQHPNRYRNVYQLMVPDGGRLEGIDEWDTGMPEVYARHRYERLYLGVCHMTSRVHLSPHSQFLVPEDPMLNRILGCGQHWFDREVRVDCERSLPADSYRALHTPAPPPLPVTYSARYRCVGYDRERLAKGRNAPVAPEMPLVVYRTANPHGVPEPEPMFHKLAVDKVLGTPVLGPAVDPVSGNVTDRRLLAQAGGNKYWYRCEPDNQEARHRWAHTLYTRCDFSLDPEDICDGTDSYVGVDGHLYKRDNEFVGTRVQYSAPVYRYDSWQSADYQPPYWAPPQPPPGQQ